MLIKDSTLALKVRTLLPEVMQREGVYANSESWRLAARMGIFRQLQAIEELAYEDNTDDRVMALYRATEGIGALLMYLELSHRNLVERSIEGGAGGVQYLDYTGSTHGQ